MINFTNSSPFLKYMQLTGLRLRGIANSITGKLYIFDITPKMKQVSEEI